MAEQRLPPIPTDLTTTINADAIEDPASQGVSSTQDKTSASSTGSEVHLLVRAYDLYH